MWHEVDVDDNTAAAAAALINSPSVSFYYPYGKINMTAHPMIQCIPGHTASSPPPEWIWNNIFNHPQIEIWWDLKNSGCVGTAEGNEKEHGMELRIDKCRPVLPPLPWRIPRIQRVEGLIEWDLKLRTNEVVFIVPHGKISFVWSINENTHDGNLSSP